MDGLLARGRPGVLEIPAEEGLADGPAPSGSRPFDVTLLVVPVLVVLGVALLFPTTTRVAARRRREVGGRPGKIAVLPPRVHNYPPCVTHTHTL